MDINLFDDFNYRRPKGNSLVLIFVFIVFILFIILITSINHFKIVRLEAELDKRKEIIENPEYLKKTREAKELNSELNIGKKKLEELYSLDEKLGHYSGLNYEILEAIDLSIQDGIVLYIINHDNGIVELKGAGISPNRIAEYSQVLGESKAIEAVHISNISLSEGYYEFLISLTLKGDSIEIYD